MLSARKKLLIPLIVLVLMISTAIPAFASMPTSYSSTFSWHDKFLGYYNSNGQTTTDTKRRQTRLIQRTCNAIENSGLVADGYFGSLTEDAVMIVQKDCDEYVDGIVGPDTWYAFQYYFDDWQMSSEIYSGGLYYRAYQGNPNVWPYGVAGYYIRHYNNGDWKVQGSDGVWYNVLP